MKRLLILQTIFMVVMFASTVVVLSDDQATGSARLHQIDQSGIEATIIFLDSGPPLNTLVISGEASGLDPEQTYISLIYDKDALPGGPNACVPSTFPSPLSGDQMSVGMWIVTGDGTGTLFAIKTGPFYAPLSEIGAMSVRVVDPVPPPDLQACGRVHSNK
ncbi:MAG: hypothetical protein L0Y68_08865 [Candidatus Dadabacteria bacterium]|nr:hypothetical protein [Candidatus Dadabacteria bacterium]